MSSAGKELVIKKSALLERYILGHLHKATIENIEGLIRKIKAVVSQRVVQFKLLSAKCRVNFVLSLDSEVRDAVESFARSARLRVEHLRNPGTRAR